MHHRITRLALLLLFLFSCGIFVAAKTLLIGLQSSEPHFLTASCGGTSPPEIAVEVFHPVCPEGFGKAVAPLIFADQTLLWSTGDTTQSVHDLSPGSYFLTVTSATEDCTATGEFTIFEATSIPLFSSQRPDCGMDNGNVAGFYDFNATYAWNTGDTTRSIFNLAPGTYTLTLTDTTADCTVDYSFDLNEENRPWTDLETRSYASQCGDSTGRLVITLEGNPEDFQIAWSTGDSLRAVRNLLPGNYGLTISSTSGDCADTFLLAVDSSAFFFNSTLARNPECEVDDGAIDATNYERQLDYVWENGDTTSVRTNLSPGIYSVTATDTAGCIYRDTFTLQRRNLAEEIIFSTNCTNPDSVVLTAYLQEGAQLSSRQSFIWNTGQQDDNSVATQIVVEPGSLYELFVVDPLGCEAIFSDIDPLEYCDANQVLTVVDVVIGTTVYQPGDTAPCVTIRVETEQMDSLAASGIAGTIQFDPDKLAFSSARSIFNGLASELVPSPGEFRFLYADFSLSGQHIANREIVEVCFQPLVSEGTAQLIPSGQVLGWQLVSANVEEIIPDVSTGSIDFGISSVWPGDASNNGLVNHYDILNIGLGSGLNGPQRPDASLDWEEQLVTSWENFIPPSGINAAHADTDGNGIVQPLDLEAIELNWTQVTPFYDPLFDDELISSAQSSASVPLLVLPDTVTVDSSASFSLQLGTEQQQATKIYGLAFSIFYDEIVIDESAAITLDFNESWLGTFGADLIAIYRVFPEDNRIDVGITRIDGQAVNGYGQIAVLNVTIEDVIFRTPRYPFDFSLSGQRLVNDETNEVSSNAMTTTSFLRRSIVSSARDPLLDAVAISLYPNPTTGKIWYASTTEAPLEKIILHRANGQLEREFTASQLRRNTLELSPYPAGVYFLSFVTARGISVRRLVLR